MRIRNTKKETSKKLFNKVLVQAKKGFNPLKHSDPETIELLRQYDNSLVTTMESYIYRVVNGKEAEDAGLCEPASVLRGKLVSKFSLEATEGLYSVMDAFIPQYNSYLINLLETVFDMSLLVEQASLRQFYQTYAFQRTLTQVGAFEYMGYYGVWVVHIDVNTGVIKKLKNSFKNGINSLSVNTKTGTAIVEEKPINGIDTVKPLQHIVYDNWQLQGVWTTTQTPKTEGEKFYYKTQLSDAKNDPWGSAFTMLNHQLIALCLYGYDLIKHCRGNTGLLSIDHINKNTTDNRGENIRVLSREDNRKLGKEPDFKPMDWGLYWQRVNLDRTNRNL